MANREIKPPEETVSTGSYSAGLMWDGWLYISGHGSPDLRDGTIVPGAIGEETQRTLEHIGRVLDATARVGGEIAWRYPVRRGAP